MCAPLSGPLGEGQPAAQEVGDSSDEGDEPGQVTAEEEVEGMASGSEYSEEETDEEVSLHVQNTSYYWEYMYITII